MLFRSIEGHIKRIRKECPGARFGIIGVSVGSIIALHAAKLIKDLGRIMLVSVYGSNAAQVQEHPSLGFMRDYFESRSMDAQRAARAFGHLEPTYHLRALGKRPLLIFACETDSVVKFSNTTILLDKLKTLKLNFAIHMVKARRHTSVNFKSLHSRGTWSPFLLPLLQDERPVRNTRNLEKVMS